MMKNVLLILGAGILTISLKKEVGLVNIVLSVLLALIVILKVRKALPLIGVTVLFFLLIVNFKAPDIPKDIEGVFRVQEVRTNYYIMKCDRTRFVCYSDEDFNLNSKIKIAGKTERLKTGMSSSVSSFNDYLSTQGTYYELEIIDYDVLSEGDTLRPKIHRFLTRNLHEESASMIELLLLADKSKSTDFYDTLIDLSVVQLFVISGFHLNILCSIIDKLFPKQDKVIWAPMLLLPYIYLVNFTIPIMRAFLFIVLTRIIKRYNLNCNRMTVVAVIAFSFLVIDYHLLYNLSFQLTFLVSFVLEVLNNLPSKGVIQRFILNPFLIQLSIFPLLMNLNFQVAPLAFITNALLSFPITVLYIASWLTAFIKIFDVIYYPFVKGMLALLEVLHGISPVLITGRPVIIIVLLFYILFGLYIYNQSTNNKRRSKVLFASLLACYCLGCFYYDLFSPDSVTFINVGQGDSTLISTKHNKNNILIDTGGSTLYDVADSKLIPYLKANGIRKLDMVIITHMDYDHYGALDSLLQNFKVNEVVYGFQQEYIRCGDINLHNLNTNIDDDSEKNEMSAVFSFKHCDTEFLVMGDAPVSVEQKLIDSNSLKLIDVLRIGHHGSKTSSSIAFLEYTDPKVAIISVGGNPYGLPNKSVLETLDNMSIPYYRTDYDGNIIVTRNGLKVRV